MAHGSEHNITGRSANVAKWAVDTRYTCNGGETKTIIFKLKKKKEKVNRHN